MIIMKPIVRAVQFSTFLFRPLVLKRQTSLYFQANKCYSSSAVLLQGIPDIEITHTKAKKSEKSTKTENAFDAERDDLFPLRRAIAYHYDNGNYQLAMKLALELKDKVATIYGTNNTVYASSLSNIALMHKMLGENKDALDKYIESLQIYYNLHGKETSNNAKILGNLGKLYQSMSLSAKGIEKLQLQERAKEALFDSLQIREKIHGPNRKETILAKILIASYHHSLNQVREAIEILTHCSTIVEMQYGKEDPLAATITNNLGYFYKGIGALNDAQEFYRQALSVRSKVLGDKHPDTIVTKHNLSECLLSMGKEEEGNRLKEEILKTLENQNNTPTASPSISTTQKVETETPEPKAVSPKPETFEKKPSTRETSKANPLPHTMKVATRKKK